MILTILVLVAAVLSMSPAKSDQETNETEWIAVPPVHYLDPKKPSFEDLQYGEIEESDTCRKENEELTENKN